MRGVARTWAIMFYATSVISVEVMRWSQNNYHISCHWTSVRAQQSFQMASKQHCSSQSFIRYKVHLCYCLTWAKEEQKKKKNRNVQLLTMRHGPHICVQCSAIFIARKQMIYTYIYIYLHICPCDFFQIAYEQWSTIEIKFRCHLLIVYCWQCCIQTSLQRKRCMRASSVGLIYQTLSSLVAQIESLRLTKKIARCHCLIAQRFISVSVQSPLWKNSPRLICSCKRVNGCMERKGLWSATNMGRMCAGDTVYVFTAIPPPSHSPRQHAEVHWVAAMWLVSSC